MLNSLDRRHFLSGAAALVATRVPFRIMFEYLEAGDSLDVFLDEFPSVSRALAIAGLDVPKFIQIEA